MRLHLLFMSGTVQPADIPELTSRLDLYNFLTRQGPHWLQDDKGVLWNLDQCIRIDHVPDGFRKSSNARS